MKTSNRQRNERQAFPQSAEIANDVETDLTVEEKAIIAEGRKERQSNPSSFTPWAKVRRG
jgi:hypothetical protein